ncbi:hypothetical protein LBMAG21_08440 [Armatimonadota bacterium]|nr:hypothetical protein LBMAG21_08440 [Armatimonadota bacterium]
MRVHFPTTLQNARKPWGDLERVSADWRGGILLALLLFTLLLFTPSAFAQPSTSTAETHSKARTQLREIVSRPEFKMTKGVQKNPLQQTADWIRQRWDDFTKWFQKLLSLTPKIVSSSLFVWVFIGIFFVLGVRLLIRILKSRYRTPKLNNSPLDFTEESEEFLSSEVWLERAKEYAQANDYTKAYRAAFVALLLCLDSEGVLPFEKHRTNGEYLQHIAKSPSLFRVLKPAFWQFDTHCYGGRLALPADYAQTLALYQKLPTLVKQTVVGKVVEEVG